jgi:hypothetical protein
MQFREDRSYHVKRARAELDAAYRAQTPTIAAVHLKLCASHMKLAKNLESSEAQAELQWIERCDPFHRNILGSPPAMREHSC